MTADTTATTLATQSDFAGLMNVNKSTVTRWKQDGRLVMEGARVNVAASQQRIKETEGGRDDVAARHAAERGAALPTAPQGDDLEEDDAEEGEEAIGTRAYWQARKERALALEAERKNLVASGRLVDLQDAENVVADIIITVRQSFENMHHATAPLLVGKDQDAIRAILKEEINTILGQMVGRFAAELKLLGEGVE